MRLQLNCRVGDSMLVPVSSVKSLQTTDYQKKTPNLEEHTPRLLAAEEIEVLDGACKPRKITLSRYDIERNITDILKHGLTTTSARGFFFIPYLLQLRAHELLSNMVPVKKQGIPNERLALGIVFESLFGLTAGIRAIDSVSRADFGLLEGLPFLSSTSSQYRLLQSISYNNALSFQVGIGKRLVELGQVTPGSAVNIDGHNIKTYSRKAMKSSYITQEGRYGKAMRTFYTQDQESKKPLIAMVTYSGTSVSQITNRIAGLTRDVLGRDFGMAADKEWYCAQLIKELRNQLGISILTPVRQSKKRVAEFEAVPLDQYDKTVQGNIAALFTTMNGFDGPLRMLLKKKQDGKYFALITPDENMTAEIAMPTYKKRWRIEDFFAENGFLGINRLPSMNLNAKQAVLSLRLLAFHAMDNFRNDLGPDYRKKTPELIYREFVSSVHGKIQLRGDVIEVTIFGFEHENAAAAILSGLDEKLEKANVDPRIPWLGNRRIRFKFC